MFTAIALVLVLGIPLMCMMVLEPRNFQIRTEKIAAEGIAGRVLFLTDLHFGRYFGRAKRLTLQNLIGRVVQERSIDAIFFGGDYLDRRWKYCYQLEEFLSALKVHGIPMYGVIGNHDHDYGDINLKKLLIVLQKHGVRMLRNERVQLALTRGHITLIGIDDIELMPGYKGKRTKRPKFYREQAAQLDMYGKILRKGLAKPIVLLSHNPDGVYLKADPKPDLVLSGHTHGGQSLLLHLLRWPLWFLAPRGSFQTWAGRRKVGKTELIVSRGLGSSLIPIRLFRAPELILVTFSD